MIKNDGYGWATVSIGGFQDTASYITDVPIDCLNAFINAFRYQLPACVQFDAEGYTYILIATWDEALVCMQKESACDYTVRCSTNLYLLANELIRDIEDNEYSWSMFCDCDSDNIENDAAKIVDKLDELRSYVRSKDTVNSYHIKQ